MAFGSGSKVAMPLKNEAGMPLNGFEVAQNVAEALAYNPDIRYIGMAIYCIDEKALYRFKEGITDDDFVVDSSDSQLDVEKEEDPTAIETVTINGVDENILVTKTVQKIGLEETTVSVANQDSSDGSILVGDVVSITKVINGIEIYTYHILDDNELYNPFE